MLLSVVVITKNEELDFPGFLENFLLIADEIVVIDDGSTDKTKEIALAAGKRVRFISNPRKVDEGFCDQRQKGVGAARGEWLLQVDCDMRLSPELATEIQRAIKVEGIIACRFRLSQYFMNRRVRYGGFQYWNQPWLSRRMATLWSQKVHERINLTAEPNQIRQLEGRMEHLNDSNFYDRLRKNRQYSELEALRIAESGKRIHVWDFVLFPLWRSVRAYIFMGGFRDGALGFLWSYYQLVGLTTIYFLAWEKQNSGSRAENEKMIKQRMEKFCVKKK